MTRTTTLLALGMLVAGSTPAFAQQITTAPEQPAPQEHAVAPTTHPTAQAATTALAAPADTAWVWEPSPSGRSSAQIKEAQTWLAQLNLLKPYDPYDPGRMTPDTEDALRQFERTHNLPVTGQISDTLMTLLHRAALSAGLPACQ